MEWGLVAVVVLALIFAYVNGFHDAAGTIATSVATRALTPGIAIAVACGFNLTGALLGQQVAYTIGSGILTLDTGNAALAVVAAGLLAAIGWDLLTWLRGIPSSSSHALIGGLTGAGLAATMTVHWEVILRRVAIPMVVVPGVALLAAGAVTVAVMWLHRDSSPSRTFRRFEHAQAISAAALSLGHGISDGQKAMGAIMLALVADGRSVDGVPLWVRLSAAAALALGTAGGGWRIVRTLGRRLVDLDAPRGFVVEAVSAGLLYATAFGLGAAVSTTHTVTGAVVGSGVVSPSAVRWRIVRDIALAWVLTPVVTAAAAAGFCLIALLL